MCTSFEKTRPFPHIEFRGRSLPEKTQSWVSDGGFGYIVAHSIKATSVYSWEICSEFQNTMRPHSEFSNWEITIVMQLQLIRCSPPSKVQDWKIHVTIGSTVGYNIHVTEKLSKTSFEFFHPATSWPVTPNGNLHNACQGERWIISETYKFVSLKCWEELIFRWIVLTMLSSFVEGVDELHRKHILLWDAYKLVRRIKNYR